MEPGVERNGFCVAAAAAAGTTTETLKPPHHRQKSDSCHTATGTGTHQRETQVVEDCNNP